MKNIKVTNSKISKSGKSINFNYKGQWYSVKKNVIKQNIGEIPLDGKIISITSHRNSSSWIMIDSFEIIGQIKEKVFDVKNTNLIPIEKEIDKKSKEKYVKIIDDFFEDLETFSPLELLDNEYASSTDETSFKVTYINSLKDVEDNKNSHISTIQNIITRGLDIRTLINKIDSQLFILILDFYKRGYLGQELTFVIPNSKEVFVKNTKLEIIEYAKIFSKISKNFPDGLKEFLNTISFQFISKDEMHIVLTKESMVLCSMKTIKRKTRHSPPVFISQKNINYKKLDKYPQEVNKLLKLVFYNNETKISKLKPEQLKALDSLMNGQQNILAVLKTGFGKSLIYQFASVLQPRIFLNVFPINSLIKDQSLSLKKEFNLTYIIDNEELKRIDGDKLQQTLLSTKRLFLITPERLENKRMQDYFHSLHKMIGYMIFDEAHCISEWGHDFRPSYLMARHLMENLMKTDKLNVIALTATAAPHIQKDIAKLLSIKRANIINIADSSGLNRKEINYKIIKEEIYDFDTWNRSEQFANIIDSYIERAREFSTQGIAFFMKSGSDQDLVNNKFLIKNNAFSAFERMHNKNGSGLYTGKNKFIEDKRTQVSNARFNEFQQLDFIMATKSFGMGINLKKCDYVLLTELPYSLEDLYQQSGRVGRMGQNSIVEIIYHNRSLIDPLHKISPYEFFLKINSKRKKGQLKLIHELIEIIYQNNAPFILETKNMYQPFSEEKQNYLKWGISHLITEFNLIDKYYVEYGGMFRIEKIGIFPKELPSKREFLNFINKKNEKLGFDIHSDDLYYGLETYYNYYFDKLQNDKLIGINILRAKLEELDEADEINGGKLITEALTDYYKTRVDEVDKVAINIMDLLMKETNLNKLKDYFINNSKKIDTFELMESISRYSINKEYIEIASLLTHYLSSEKILVSNLSKICSTKYTVEYLQDLKNEIITKLFFYEIRDEEEWRNVKGEILLNVEWKNIEEKIFIKNIMEELNGKDF